MKVKVLEISTLHNAINEDITIGSEVDIVQINDKSAKLTTKSGMEYILDRFKGCAGNVIHGFVTEDGHLMSLYLKGQVEGGFRNGS